MPGHRRVSGLLFVAGRWAWLGVALASLLLGAYLFVQLERFDDTADLAAEIAHLREFQDKATMLGLRASIGLTPESASHQLVAQAERYVSETVQPSGAMARDLEEYLEHLHDLAALSDRLAMGETTLTDAAFTYAAISANANRELDEALALLSADGHSAVAELRRISLIGLGLLVVAGIASAIGFGWTSSRARALSADVERTRELDRMKSEFVALASHELRTPLTGIYGFSKLLGQEQISDRQRNEWATHIHSEAERLTKIVDELLSVSKIDAGGLDLAAQPVSVRDVVDAVLPSFADTQEAHTIEVLGDPSVFVLGDRSRLIEVLGNLVENAVKYSPEGGPVRISWERIGDRARLRVSDEGLGVPEDAFSTIFDRFTRVALPDREHIRSTGLGLYLVRELVTRMGGDIEVESTLGRGSTFTVTLPLRTSESAPVTEDARFGAAA